MGELNAELRRLSGGTKDAAGAANDWAGTTGLELVGALNAKAGTSGLEFDGVLNVLAGTMGIGTNKCLSLIANGGGSGVSFSDNFDRADNADLGPNWKELLGNINIVSNEAKKVGTATTDSIRCEVSLDTADHFSQIVVRHQGDGTGLRGVNTEVRVNEPVTDDWANHTAYYFRYEWNNLQWKIEKKTGNNEFTSLATLLDIAPTLPYTQRTEAVGDTIRGLVNGVEKLSVTDTQLTGTKAGVHCFQGNNTRLDDFETGDL